MQKKHVQPLNKRSNCDLLPFRTVLKRRAGVMLLPGRLVAFCVTADGPLLVSETVGANLLGERDWQRTSDERHTSSGRLNEEWTQLVLDSRPIDW